MMIQTIQRFIGTVIRTGSAALVLTLLAGCGPAGPELVPVSGQVRLKGSEESLMNIGVIFVPKRGTGGLAAGGAADADGIVTLKTNDRSGVKPGDYFVGIFDKTVSVTAMFEQQQPGGGLFPRSNQFPRFHHKYNAAEYSGLEMTVSADNGTFDFEVEPHPKHTPDGGG